MIIRTRKIITTFGVIEITKYDSKPKKECSELGNQYFLMKTY